ncbi:T9SS type B sorting domain-containing protein [Epilithonimonas mollis]|uniref:Gliding motility-associated C-terminal domain-containing protein n=1 Tax=Epilithonimonas mollis TaxID=216903 RepID=A0A1M6NWC6_9FLAO|nr:T9SS type B sorting domain-containing protein [Epilithonimonas mollis]SHJ99962.1 gliding motility-associated C-terminal domain-containing protein [Epilithonimonas mollis]
MRNVLSILFGLFSIAIFSQTSLQVVVTDTSGNENFHVSCTHDLDSNGCLLLNVKYPEIKATTGYDVTQENYTLPVPINQGTALNADYDDLFATKLDLPFKFCFFNQPFESIIVGSNGMVTFDLSQLGKINYPNVDWTNPNPNLPKNSIFGVYHDIVFSSGDSSEIYYSVIGTAPNRRFVISFYNGRVTGCTDRSSSQIVLHETTNIIDVFVEKKDMPCPTRKFENAMIGVMNGDGTIGVSPSNRNTGLWQAYQEAWRFTPQGNAIVPEVTWTDSSGQNVGSGIQATVCPTQNETYTANVKFNICGSDFITLKDDFTITFDPTYPVAKNYTQSYCGTTSQNIDLDDFKPNITSQNPTNFTFTYHESRADAQSGQNAIPANYTLTANKIFYVRIQNPSIPTCYRIAVLTLNFLSKNLIKDTVEICDTNNDGIEKNYNLSLINKELFPSGTTDISYYLSESDAENNISPVTNIDITTSTIVWLKVSTTGCTYVLGPLKFKFKPGVNLNSPINFSFSMCDINDDNTEPFSFDVIIGPLVSNDPGVVFKAYQTYAAAFSGTGSTLKTIKDGQYKVYIRVEIPNGCFAIAEVNMDVTFTKVEVKKKDVYICFNGTDDISVDLLTLSSDMLISPSSVPIISYYSNMQDASTSINPIPTNQIITEDGNFVTKTFYVRFEQSIDCYTVRPINIRLVHPIIFNSTVMACDFDNDNTELVQLAQFTPAIIGTQTATTQFYDTLQDAQSGLRRITSTTVNGTKQIFVKITSYGCSEIYPLNIGLTSTPVVNSAVNININNICDNNNDGTEIYNLQLAQPQIYSGSDVTYTYYRSYNAVTHVFSDIINSPDRFPVPGNATVYARVKYNSNNCFSAAQINIKMSFLPPVVVKSAVLNKCDLDFNLNETFQLNDAIPQLFNASENVQPLSDMQVSYYRTAAQANIGNPANQLGNTFTTNISTVEVWARFESKTLGCYSTASIKLNTYLPPKAINSTIRICDENLDGNYEVNLMNFTSQMVDISNPINTFTFYPTLTDAQRETNAITDPQNYISTPFPRQVWVKVQNIPGCNDIASIDLVQANKINIQNTVPYQLVVCKDGDSGIANLSQVESQIYPGAGASFLYYPSLPDLNAGTNPITNPTDYSFSSMTGSNIIYVRVVAPGLCPDKAEIHLSIKPAPEFDIPTQYICPGDKLDYTVSVPGFTIKSYVWTNPAGQVIGNNTSSISDIGEIGTYKLTVTADNGCSYTDTFELTYYDVPVIERLEANGNTYTIFTSGSKPVLYSMDGVTWQPENIYTNLPVGIQTFYVKYEGEDCIVKQQGVILNIPNVITPNGDGYNDQWIVRNLHVFGGKPTNVKIYDRFQVLVFEQSSNTEIVWNGKIRGREIPTTSYWYIITLPDGQQFTGWIVLKNRLN